MYIPAVYHCSRYSFVCYLSRVNQNKNICNGNMKNKIFLCFVIDNSQVTRFFFFSFLTCIVVPLPGALCRKWMMKGESVG